MSEVVSADLDIAESNLGKPQAVVPEVLLSSDVDAEGYATHVLNFPHFGRVSNGIASIDLEGQFSFQLADDGSPLVFE
jgi:hypothetical protein